VSMTCRRLGFGLLAWASVAGPTHAAVLRHGADRIEGRYIVVLKNDVRAASTPARTAQDVVGEHERRYGIRRRLVYSAALAGYLADMSEAQAEAVAADPQVAWVEADAWVYASATQVDAPWGLDRIDQRSAPIDGTYSYGYDGAGVHAYVIDTGLQPGHPEFGGRVGNGFAGVSDGQGTSDCNGHGTHVSGTIAGTTFGVAKRAFVHPVRVLNCDGMGSTSGVIAGIDWVRANAVKPAVANLSLGGLPSATMDAAVVNAIAAGVVFVAAAGNDTADACSSSPARVPAVITVGAASGADARASFSNYGTCVDLFAPGVAITSAWNNGGSNTISGTSMASPHAAGVAALYLQQNPGSSPAAVASALVAAATNGVLTNLPSGSPNRLLYSRFPSSTPTPTPTTAPTPTPVPTPAVSIGDASIVEGAVGVTLVALPVTLSHAYPGPVTVAYSTEAGTAAADVDYVSRSGVLLFAPGQIVRRVLVAVRGDQDIEPDERLAVRLSSPTNAVLAQNVGTVAIVNDDPVAAATLVDQYRLYSARTGEHLYTTDANEYAVLGRQGWSQEGVAYRIFGEGGTYAGVPTVPFYRLFHEATQQHHWTTDANEAAVLADSTEWSFEGVVGHMLPAGTGAAVPLYRLVLPSPLAHLWTSDAHEKSVLTASTRSWTDEGVVGFVFLP
jgi:subtilisin family serine protease